MASVQFWSGLKKAKPADRFEQAEFVALVRHGKHLVAVSVEGNTYDPAATFGVHVFTPTGANLGQPRSLELKGFGISPAQQRIFAFGDSIVALADNAKDEPVLLEIDPAGATLLGQHHLAGVTEWGHTRHSGDRLFVAAKRGAKQISIWKRDGSDIKLETTLTLPFDDWGDFAIAGDHAAWKGRDHAPTRFFGLDGGRLTPRGELKGKLNQQSEIALYEDGYAVLYGAHKKASVIDARTDKPKAIATVAVANSYEHVARFGELLLLCSANANSAPTATVVGKLDLVQLGADGAERIAIAAPAYMLDAVAGERAMFCLTSEALLSYAL